LDIVLHAFGHAYLEVRVFRPLESLLGDHDTIGAWRKKLYNIDARFIGRGGIDHIGIHTLNLDLGSYNGRTLRVGDPAGDGAASFLPVGKEGTQEENWKDTQNTPRTRELRAYMVFELRSHRGTPLMLLVVTPVRTRLTV
jgi:hypothetical protein